MRRICLALLATASSALPLSAANSSPTGGGQPLPVGQPALGLRYMIALQGVFPANGGGGPGAGQETMLGEIRLFAFAPGSTMPGGWAECNGQPLSIAQNSALFAILGTTFGGDGRVTFGLPDLRGRLPVGAGTVVGLTPRILGEPFGAVSPALTPAQLPAHRHSMAGGAQTGLTGSGAPVPLWRPSLGLNPILSPVSGRFNYLPEIRWFAGNYQPGDWVFVDGRALLIANYTALFSHLGVTYGGNGATDFQLPRLIGRAAIGAGQAPGLSLYTAGGIYGAETATLDATMLPAHVHTTAAGPTGLTGAAGPSLVPVNRLQPVTAIHYMIAATGVFPSTGFNPGPTPTVGEIRAFAGPTAPAEFIFCEGQLLQISANTTLFNLIGTTFGGDGVSTFGLPDLRGRAPAGIGSGPLIPPLLPGEQSGFETTPLTTALMASHLHSQPPPSIAILGNGIAIANGGTALSLADFTQFPTMDAATGSTSRTYTIQNSGLGDLTPALLPPTGSWFSNAIAPGGVVAPGASTSFQIGFAPRVEGVFTSTVTVSSDDPALPSYSYRIGGNGANNLALRHPGPVGGTLRVAKNAGNASRLDFAWGVAGCPRGTTGYAVYEGALGSFSSHALMPGQCNVNGAGVGSVAPSTGSRYYLVSAIDGLALEEGSLGRSSTGVEALHPGGACMAATDLAAICQ